MARLLIGNDWYEELASTSLYESEFENILFQEASRIFPEYHAVPFKCLVVSEEGDAKADFALVHKDYRSWWVVEAEMGHHSLNGHVVPQVRKLSQANYTDSEAQYLCDHARHLDCFRIQEMIKGQQPRVLVVANVPVPGWREAVQPYSAVVAVFQIFRSQLNRHIFRLNGDFPSENSQIISTCRCWEIHRFLKVDSPTQLEVKRGETIILQHETGALAFERIDMADAVLLHALRDHPLKKNIVYEIVRRNDGAFAIQPSRTKLL